MERCKHDFGGDEKWVGGWEVLKRYTCKEMKKAGWARRRHWDAVEQQSGLSLLYRALRSVMALQSFPKWSKGGPACVSSSIIWLWPLQEGLTLGWQFPRPKVIPRDMGSCEPSAAILPRWGRGRGCLGPKDRIWSENHGVYYVFSSYCCFIRYKDMNNQEAKRK